MAHSIPIDPYAGLDREQLLARCREQDARLGALERIRLELGEQAERWRHQYETAERMIADIRAIQKQDGAPLHKKIDAACQTLRKMFGDAAAMFLPPLMYELAKCGIADGQRQGQEEYDAVVERAVKAEMALRMLREKLNGILGDPLDTPDESLVQSVELLYADTKRLGRTICQLRDERDRALAQVEQESGHLARVETELRKVRAALVWCQKNMTVNSLDRAPEWLRIVAPLLPEEERTQEGSDG